MDLLVFLKNAAAGNISLGAALKGAAGAVKNLSIQLFKLIASNTYLLAIAAIIGAIVGAFKLLSSAFKRNEENGEKVGASMAKLGGIFKGFIKLLEPIAAWIANVFVKVFEGLSNVVFKAIDLVGKGLKALGFDDAAKKVDNLTDSLKKTSNAAEKLES